GGVAPVGQVGEERLQLRRGQHALVGDGARRQAGEVDAGLVFGALAHAVGVALQVDAGEAGGGAAGGAGEERLGEVRHGLAGGGAAVARLHGQVVPAEDGEAFFGGDGLDAGDGCCAVGLAGGQERDAGGVGAGFGQVEAGGGAVELVGDLGEDPGAVAVVGV